jgi:AcrR family transcriptional regulator
MIKSTLKKPIDGRQKARPGPEEQTRIIVDTAVNLFLQHDVRSVSIMQICDAADVSRSTFYRCFNDIDSLLQYIYNISVFEPVEQFMTHKWQPSENVSNDIKQALYDMYEAIFAQSAYAELLFRESNNPNSPAYHIVNNAFDNIIAALQKFHPKNKQQPIDQLYLKAILNANQWIAHNAISSGLTPNNKKMAKEAAWKLVENSLRL